jgi:hypothetical protein
MAFSSTTQSGVERMFERKFCVRFKGTAGASGNTISSIPFVVQDIYGLPNGGTFTQSGSTVTVSGLTNTNVYSLILVEA